MTFSSCSWLKSHEDETKSWSASKLYSEAKAELQDGDYETAINYYEKLEARFPYGKYAQQALLDVAYAYWKYDEPESAIATTDRFIKLHPRHPNVDYAYYLRGLIVFPLRRNIFEYIVPQEEADRDASTSLESFQYFSELVQRFPNSRYSEDARYRMGYLRNKVARHALHVAQYYLAKKAYIAAINRAKYILKHFQEAPVSIAALDIMKQAYIALDMPQLAKDTQKVIEKNRTQLIKQKENVL